MTRPFIIDTHGHIGATSGFRAYYASTDEMVRLMDVMATQAALVVPMGALHQQFDLGYRQAREAIARHPGRIYCYTVFDPQWPELSLKLIDEHIGQPGFVGVKIHPAVHAVAPGDARYRDFWAYANQHRLVVLSHTWSPDPAKPVQNLSVPDLFGEILDRYPDMQLILGHCGGRELGQRQAIELLRTFPNCWADLSGDWFALDRLEWLVDQTGPERLLHGTDSNWIEPRYALAYLVKSSLSAEVRMKILRENALRLFGPYLEGLETKDSALEAPPEAELAIPAARCAQ